MTPTNYLKFVLAMVGCEENFSTLKVLICLFQHFSAVFSACCCLRMMLLKRRRKIRKVSFYTNLKHGSLYLCDPAAMAALIENFGVSDWRILQELWQDDDWSESLSSHHNLIRSNITKKLKKQQHYL